MIAWDRYAPTTRARAEELLDAATEWAERGIRVVACRGKNPGGHLGRGWPEAASTREGQLVEWWRRWPSANVGIVAFEDVLPVDADDPAVLAQLEAELGPLPPTPRCYTGGGEGRERIILQHPGGDLPHELVPDFTLRDGVAVSIVPPSINPDSGELYEWSVALDEVDPAPLPGAWLARCRERLQTNGTRPAARDWHQHVGEHVPAGQRHEALVGLAALLLGRLRHVDLTRDLLLAWNQAHCQPPKPAGEVLAILAWVVEREAAV